MRHQESIIQQTCVRWFRMKYPQLALLLFAVPNGGARLRSEAAIMKAEGTMKGVADLLLLFPAKRFHGLCIEMKTRRADNSHRKRHGRSGRNGPDTSMSSAALLTSSWPKSTLI